MEVSTIDGSLINKMNILTWAVSHAELDMHCHIAFNLLTNKIVVLGFRLFPDIFIETA